MRTGNILLVILIVVGVVAASVGGYFWWKSTMTSEPFCSKESKICPDGSSVGRKEPNCNFTPCPTLPDPTANWKTYTSQIYGIQMSYPDYMRFIHEDIFGDGKQETISFEFKNGDGYMSTDGGTAEFTNFPAHDKITVLEKPVIRYSIISASDNLPFRAYGFNLNLKNGKQITMNIQVQMTDYANSMKILDQILSTFKFL